MNTKEVALRLGIKHARGNMFHCFMHKDSRPSLFIKDGFMCHSCQIKGNTVDLVKIFLNVSTEKAFEWLKDKNITIEKSEPEEKIEQKFIDESYYIERLELFQDNLFRFFVNLTIPQNFILKQRNLGTHGGFSFFFFRDEKHRICNVKKIKYLPDGKRDRKLNPSFVASKKDGYLTPFFNAHLIPDYEKIVIVESEKSAILASYLKPEYCWIASGGSKGVTDYKALALKGKEVIVLYDCDEPGRTGAEKAYKIIKKVAKKIKIINTYPDRNDGFDIGDEVALELAKHKLKISELNDMDGFEERAAIIQFDSGFSRIDAEKEALKREGK